MKATAKWMASAVVCAVLVTLTPGSASAKAPRKPSLTANTTAAQPGANVKLTGRAPGAQRKVLLQRKASNGRWRTIATQRSKATGRYTFRTKIRSGRTQYRVVAAKNARFKKTTSRSLVLVGRRPASVTQQAPSRPPVTEPTVPKINKAEVERYVRQYINDFRAENGLPGFTNNPCLTDFANTFSALLAEHMVLAHSSSSYYQSLGAPHYFTVCRSNTAESQSEDRGEIAATVWSEVRGYGSAGTARDIVDAWIGSPGHRAWLLVSATKNHTLGLSVSRGSNGAWYAVGVPVGHPNL